MTEISLHVTQNTNKLKLKHIYMYYTRNNLNLQEMISAETKSIESKSSFKKSNQVTVPAFYMIGRRGGQILG